MIFLLNISDDSFTFHTNTISHLGSRIYLFNNYFSYNHRDHEKISASDL